MFLTLYNSFTGETLALVEVKGDFLLSLSATPYSGPSDYLRAVGHNGLTPGLDRVSVSTHKLDGAVDIFDAAGEVMGTFHPRWIEVK